MPTLSPSLAPTFRKENSPGALKASTGSTTAGQGGLKNGRLHLSTACYAPLFPKSNQVVSTYGPPKLTGLGNKKRRAATYGVGESSMKPEGKETDPLAGAPVISREILRARSLAMAVLIVSTISLISDTLLATLVGGPWGAGGVIGALGASLVLCFRPSQGRDGNIVYSFFMLSMLCAIIFQCFQLYATVHFWQLWVRAAPLHTSVCTALHLSAAAHGRLSASPLYILASVAPKALRAPHRRELSSTRRRAYRRRRRSPRSPRSTTSSCIRSSAIPPLRFPAYVWPSSHGRSCAPRARAARSSERWTHHKSRHIGLIN